MKKRFSHSVIALMIVFACSNAHANLVTNGGFELGDYNNLDLDTRPEIMLVTPGMTNITGWTVEGQLGVHWVNDTIKDGLYAVDLQGKNPSNTNEYSSLWTEFSTVAGGAYILEFDAFTGNTTNLASVSVGDMFGQLFNGGAPTQPYDPPNFDHYKFTFNATSNLSKLIFSIYYSDGFGPVIDNVKVVGQTPVPESTTMLLFGTGLAGLAAVGRRRRLK